MSTPELMSAVAEPATRRHTVLVGVDGRVGGLDATALAADLAGEKDAIVLVSLAVAGPLATSYVDPDLSAEARRSCTAHLATAQDLLDLRAGARADRCGVAEAARTVATGLATVARDRHADLLVIGSSHYGAPGRIVGLNDVRATLRSAPCALAVAPHGYAYHPPELRRITVAWDGTPQADAAVDVAALLAERLGADRRVMDIRPSQHLRDLAEVARETDLLVVSTPAADGHLRPGSTVAGLVRDLPCALLVVPPCGLREIRSAVGG